MRMQLGSNFGWDLLSLVNNTGNYGTKLAPKIGRIFGIFLLVAGFVVLGMGLFKKSSTQQPVQYGVAFGLIILGGILTFATWKNMYHDVGNSMQKTVTEMGSTKSEGMSLLSGILSTGVIPPLF